MCSSIIIIFIYWGKLKNEIVGRGGGLNWVKFIVIFHFAAWRERENWTFVIIILSAYIKWNEPPLVLYAILWHTKNCYGSQSNHYKCYKLIRSQNTVFVFMYCFPIAEYLNMSSIGKARKCTNIFTLISCWFYMFCVNWQFCIEWNFLIVNAWLFFRV